MFGGTTNDNTVPRMHLNRLFVSSSSRLVAGRTPQPPGNFLLHARLMRSHAFTMSLSLQKYGVFFRRHLGSKEAMSLCTGVLDILATEDGDVSEVSEPVSGHREYCSAYGLS